MGAAERNHHDSPRREEVQSWANKPQEGSDTNFQGRARQGGALSSGHLHNPDGPLDTLCPPHCSVCSSWGGLVPTPTKGQARGSGGPTLSTLALSVMHTLPALFHRGSPEPDYQLGKEETEKHWHQVAAAGLQDVCLLHPRVLCARRCHTKAGSLVPTALPASTSAARERPVKALRRAAFALAVT